jgi:hypothetical protein
VHPYRIPSYGRLPRFAHLAPGADVPSIDTNELSLDGLRAQAAALGITVDRRWGASRLAQEIAAKQGA